MQQQKVAEAARVARMAEAAMKHKQEVAKQAVANRVAHEAKLAAQREQVQDPTITDSSWVLCVLISSLALAMEHCCVTVHRSGPGVYAVGCLSLCLTALKMNT